ncbi:Luciferase [Mycena sanguinolenta]|uniref:Luciferase n=1 Tax=Mycena sanguinolenta TaxID=230812 RepID=A0A8H6YAJ0_9AGAR|nr:Luciferase [Mycena sanguinolenta]
MDYHTFLEVGSSYAPQNVHRWLSELPVCEGPRPKTTSHIIQRQLDQHVEPEFGASDLKSAVIQRVQARHTDKTHLALSKFEFHAEAIFLRPSIPIDDPKNVPSHDTVRRTKREIAYMRDYHDFTLHLALAAQDGKQVGAKGWGAEASIGGTRRSGPANRVGVFVRTPE